MLRTAGIALVVGVTLLVLAACSVDSSAGLSPSPTSTPTAGPSATPVGMLASTLTPLLNTSQVGRHAVGSPDAKVTVVEVFDFR